EGGRRDRLAQHADGDLFGRSVSDVGARAVPSVAARIEDSHDRGHGEREHRAYGHPLSLAPDHPDPSTVLAQLFSARAPIGSVTATLTGTKLSIAGTFQGLNTPATVARIHKSSKPGIRGPMLFDLTVSSSTSGTIGGTFDLTAAQVQELAQGRYYVQLHSEKAPEGNLWGWLLSQENRR